MLQKIKSGDFDIYTNEIIHPQIFYELYNQEEILEKFEANVIISSHHPFATFLAKDRKSINIKEGNFVILRAIKENKRFEFITKIVKWGKFSIPKIIIKTLDLKNKEKILFEIVKESKNNKRLYKNFVDLAKIGESLKIIYRKKNFITIIKEYKTPITLPRFIKINPELIEVFFLIHGDGHYAYKLYFVNKSLELHKFVIEEFEKIFKIPNTIWRARLLFNNSSNQELAKEKWRKNLNLKEEQFYPSISKCLLKTSEVGNLRIAIDKTIVSAIFRYIFKQLQNLGEKQSFHALNGLLYAEGGARKDKQGLHKITLSFNQQEKDMFQGILNKTNINRIVTIQQDKIFVISGWSNLYHFFNLFFSEDLIPFDKHTERCKKALEGFIKHSFSQTMYRYLKILNEKSNFTIKELTMITNHHPESVINTLRKKQYSKFIEIKGRGVNKNPLIISITEEGRNLITLIEKIKEVYNEKCRLG